MSSLLQHDGEVKGNKVVLKMYLVDGPRGLDGIESFLCRQCHRRHEVLYKVARRPVGMMGCWVLFRYNGAVNAPDLSIPIRVEKLPRGAERMPDEAASAYWHS
jgi:hypothetical protein